MVFKNILVVTELGAQKLYIVGFRQWDRNSEKATAHICGQVRSHLLQKLKKTGRFNFECFYNLGSGFYLTALWDARRSLIQKHLPRPNVFYFRH